MTPPAHPLPESEPPLPLATRFWLAWVLLWNVLIDGAFAAQARKLWILARTGDRPSLAAPRVPALSTRSAPVSATAAGATPATTAPAAKATRVEAVVDPAPALQLLALLQREGRFVDFLQQDVGPFSDAQVGQVARVVHAGCRKAIAAHADIEPVFGQAESTRVELPVGFDPASVKLTGQVQGSAPYRGTLRHGGWRVTRLTLPIALAGHDARILAPAEVEL